MNPCMYRIQYSIPIQIEHICISGQLSIELRFGINATWICVRPSRGWGGGGLLYIRRCPNAGPFSFVKSPMRLQGKHGPIHDIRFGYCCPSEFKKMRVSEIPACQRKNIFQFILFTDWNLGNIGHRIFFYFRVNINVWNVMFKRVVCQFPDIFTILKKPFVE